MCGMSHHTDIREDWLGERASLEPGEGDGESTDDGDRVVCP